jgi:flagellar hook assembly protein FlgD
VLLTVHDIRGRLVAKLLDSACEAGRRTVVWDGRGSDGRNVASGAYFARVQAGVETRTTKFIVSR